MRTAIALAAFLAASSAHAEIIGRASVIDGDTIEIQGQRIRLHGIDTPEKGQTCEDASSQPYRCGTKAAFALADYIGQSPVTCQERDTDRYGRIVGKCFVRGESVNAYMVRSGWAAAYRRYSSEYDGEEQAAKNSKRGIWAGSFEMPWDWRKHKREGRGEGF
jgi:endonuclease YncB( thermonuclease family)